LSQTIGDAEPSPGIATFHLMFFVSLHSVGGLPIGATPVFNGPRQAGQFFWYASDLSAANADREQVQSPANSVAVNKFFIMSEGGSSKVKSNDLMWCGCVETWKHRNSGHHPSQSKPPWQETRYQSISRLKLAREIIEESSNIHVKKRFWTCGRCKNQKPYNL